jgi:tetratricopeptide (TPR) repeat protein
MKSVSLVAIAVAGCAWAQSAHAATATDAAREWIWCNGTTREGVSDDMQIAGCTARIESGEESDINLFAAYYNRAFAHYNKTEYSLAIADYASAIQLKPTDPNPHVGRGLSYYHIDQYEQAVAEFTKAIELKPDSAEAYYRRATSYAALKKYDPAIADYDVAIRLKRDFAEAIFNRGGTYYAKRSFKPAIADFDQYIGYRPWLCRTAFRPAAMCATHSANATPQSPILIAPFVWIRAHPWLRVAVGSCVSARSNTTRRSLIWIRRCASNPIMPRHSAGEAMPTTARA